MPGTRSAQKAPAGWAIALVDWTAPFFPARNGSSEVAFWSRRRTLYTTPPELAWSDSLLVGRSEAAVRKLVPRQKGEPASAAIDSGSGRLSLKACADINGSGLSQSGETTKARTVKQRGRDSRPVSRYRCTRVARPGSSVSTVRLEGGPGRRGRPGLGRETNPEVQEDRQWG